VPGQHVTEAVELPVDRASLINSKPRSPTHAELAAVISGALSAAATAKLTRPGGPMIVAPCGLCGRLSSAAIPAEDKP
jgi:hypothetical protein